MAATHPVVWVRRRVKKETKGESRGDERRPHTEPDKLRRGLNAGLTTAETQSNHIGQREVKKRLTKNRARYTVVTQARIFPDKSQSLP